MRKGAYAVLSYLVVLILTALAVSTCEPAIAVPRFEALAVCAGCFT